MDDRDEKFDKFMLDFESSKKENRDNMAMLVALIQKSQSNSGPIVEIPPATPLQSAHTKVSSLT